MMKNILHFENRRLIISVLALTFLVGCSDDDKSDPVSLDPVAAFTPTLNELVVTFQNTSKNATKYTWDFGDKKGTSTEKDPKYTYSEAGTYEVVLTASNDEGKSDVAKAEVVVASANDKIILLSGTTSKTWKLLRDREKVSMLLASDGNFDDNTQIYWQGSSNNGERPCLYDDEFIFSADGKFEFKDNDTFWAEYGVFNNIENCSDNTKSEACFAPTADNMVNECGDDVSAWRSSSSHTYTFDANANKVTLKGSGAWIGIPKLSTSAVVTVPQNEVKFDVKLVDGGESGVDTMFAVFSYASEYWTFTYVSYEDPTKEPALASLNVNFDFKVEGLKVTFTDKTVGAKEWKWNFGDNKGTSTDQNPTYTYDKDGTYTVSLEVSDGSESATKERDVVIQSTIPEPTSLGHTFASPEGADLLSVIKGVSTIGLGVDDPAGASAAKVGKFTRVAGSEYQEAQITAAPQSKFSLKNVTTMTLDVYFPSSNDYTGKLTKGLVIGFSDELTSNEGKWWEVQSQWEKDVVPVDAWTTLSFDLKNADSGGGAKDATSRTDLDLFFLGIGGAGHTEGGDFYIRNLSIK